MNRTLNRTPVACWPNKTACSAAALRAGNGTESAYGFTFSTASIGMLLWTTLLYTDVYVAISESQPRSCFLSRLLDEQRIERTSYCSLGIK